MIELQEGILPEVDQRNPYAVVAITKHGVQIDAAYSKPLQQVIYII